MRIGCGTERVLKSVLCSFRQHACRIQDRVLHVVEIVEQSSLTYLARPHWNTSHLFERSGETFTASAAATSLLDFCPLKSCSGYSNILMSTLFHRTTFVAPMCNSARYRTPDRHPRQTLVRQVNHQDL